MTPRETPEEKRRWIFSSRIYIIQLFRAIFLLYILIMIVVSILYLRMLGIYGTTIGPIYHSAVLVESVTVSRFRITQTYRH